MGYVFDPLVYSGLIPTNSNGGGGGVTSLDGMSGAITLIPGSGISIVDGSGTITISATGASPTNQRIVELHTIDSGESAAKQIILSATPTTSNFTVLEIAGAPSQFYGADFTVTGNVLSWSGLGLDGILSTGDQLTIIYN